MLHPTHVTGPAIAAILPLAVPKNVILRHNTMRILQFVLVHVAICLHCVFSQSQDNYALRMAQQGMNHVPLQQGMKSHEQDSLGDDFFEEADADETKSETISASSTPHGNQNIILDDGIDPSTSGHKKMTYFLICHPLIKPTVTTLWRMKMI